MSLPRITVVTPSFNQAAFLETTILSVLGQGYPNLEYFVMDGGSTDGSVDTLRAYGSQLAYWTSGPDGGQSAAINAGFARATGDILCWVNSDDFLLPGTLLRVGRHFAERTAEPHLLYGSCLFFEDRGKRAKVVRPRTFDPAVLRLSAFIIQPSAFWTRVLWERTGPLDQSLSFAFDWDWFIRASAAGSFATLGEILSAYRLHAAHKSGSGGEKRRREIIEVVRRHGTPGHAAAYAHLDRHWAAVERQRALRHSLEKQGNSRRRCPRPSRGAGPAPPWHHAGRARALRRDASRLMSLRTFIWKSIDAALEPLGFELRSRAPIGNPLTMQAALERAAARELGVRTVVDIGAASGRWTRKALDLFPEARFLLLEPLEERRAELERLRAEQGRVDFLIAAAGDHHGEAALTVAPDLDGSGIYDSPSPAVRAVPLTTLDAALRERELPGPYFLKFDTHGFEVPILAGATECLRDTALIVMEVYNFQLTRQCLRFHEMCAHLDGLGFRCADVADVGLRPKDRLLWQADFFFLPKTSPLFDYPGYR